ncbi:FumA C-terminus/TtdB family hydratase beta subunit [Pyrobaculum aerophilum]|uniref:Fumarate hydratase class I beta subunit n=2 Tax=Pyrobaculum aerophilum TaxID=13773 RepID=Q8ZVT8_PYRAE|nr:MULTISPECIES: FumA C-terminus/TtdB family hydratase beta subunit [Pyrobaculum]AAL63968.1 fumarate hydratase class I beta subunit [Pyrobaculum aerophilum str. IM2]MCX8136438.1 FumA C-terminus/TtdB family hydratase beta subunit [Pyrobaculum aerophilum]HII47261.1 fumarate hydratase [Pyrobaculum aerophilum]
MPTYYLKTPLTTEDVSKLRVGDTVYISGVIVSARDSAHKRMLEYVERGEKLPVDLKGGVIYHAGPVARKKDGGWEIISMGPTTSARMEAFQADVIEKLGVKLVVGKGGMGKRTAEAMRKHIAAYAIFTGGAGVLAAKAIKRVVDVHWLDLGIAEAMWVLEVENFGPLTVMIDSTGRNYYDELREEARAKVPEILSSIEWLH